MGKHHRDRDYDRDMLDDPRMRDPRMREPRMRDPRTRDPRMVDPRTVDPRMIDPNARRNPAPNGGIGNNSSMSNIAGNVGNIVRSFAGNVNLAELLKGVDINQVLGLVTALAGGGNSNANPLLSLLGFGGSKGDPMPPGPRMAPAAAQQSMPQNGVNADAMNSQLSMLADRLTQMGGSSNGNSIQGQLLGAIRTLQQSPELMNMFNSFVNANMPDMSNMSNMVSMPNTSSMNNINMVPKSDD